MADETKVIISIETILKNLDRTLKGLSTLEKQLKAVGGVKAGASNLDKINVQAQRLTNQQQRLSIQTQELANRQARAALQADRLALSQLKLEQAFNRAASAQAKTASTTVRETQRQANEVRRINEQTARQAERQERIRTAAAKTIADVQVREAQRGATKIIQGLEQSRESAEQFARGMVAVGNSLRSAGQGITSLGFVLTGALTAPLVALGTAATQASVTMDSLTRGLTAIVGSAQEAGRQLSRLTEIAKLPGIGFQEAIQGSIRLQAVGFSAKEAEQALIQFSNAIALTGGGRDELNRVTIQLGQLASKGKVLAQDLRPIIEAAPAVGRALKQAFGTVNADDIAELSGSSEAFLKTLIAQLEELPRAASGARNSFENFRDSVFRASTALGDVLIPVLAKLAEVALPVIEFLARAFKALPFPIQVVLVVFGAFLAALGPALIVTGQLALALGRLGVAYGQMSLEASRAGVAVSAYAVAASRASVVTFTLSRAMRALGGPFLTLTLAVLTIAEAYGLYNDAQEEAVKTSKEDAIARANQNRVLRDQIGFLERLATITKATNQDQRQFAELQRDLDAQSRGRLELLSGESERIQRLIELKREQLRLGELESQAKAAALVTEVSKAIEEQEKAQAKLNAAKKQAEGDDKSTFERQVRALNVMDASAVAIERQRQGFLKIDQARGGVEKTTEAVNNLGRELKEAADGMGLTVDAFLEQARAGKVSEDILIKVRAALDALGESAKDTAIEIVDSSRESVEALKRLKDQAESDPFVVLAKTGDQALDSVLRRIKTVTDNTDDAAKALQNYIELYPDLKAAVDRAGGVRKAVEDLFKTPKGDSGTTLRNAQERLRQQLLDLGQATRDEELAREKADNEKALRENELAFSLRLKSYRDYLEARASLTSEAIDREIARQQEIVVAAQNNAAELFRKASQRNLPEVERVNRQVQANKALEDAAQAEARLLDLESRRAEVVTQLQIDFANLARQQESDIRQLEIEYAELQGRIEDALKAQVVERFRERLGELGKQQERINEKLNDQTLKLTAAEQARLKVVRERNQREIDSINDLQQTGDAMAVLATAEKFITDSKQEQSNLEQQLSFDVEFRGRKELDAIQARLRGEDQLKQRLLITRDILQDEINRLTELGVEIPERLTKVVEQINRDVQSLGKLPFAEQFRLVEDEFNRINDERLNRIADVERAIRNRTVAEIQGLLEIRLINAEYIGDLEEQSRILNEIAEASNDPRLIAQARQVEQTAKDANTELESFNTQLRSVSIDALQQGLADFFSELGDNTKTAKERILDLVSSITRSITDFIAQDFSRRIIESIFGTGSQQAGAAGGLLGALKRLGGLFGIGGGAATESAKAVDTGFGTAGKAAETGQITAAATALSTAGTTAAAALTTGGSTAGAAMLTGASGFTTAIIGAGASFVTAVTAAGAAFATAITVASGVEAAGEIGTSLAGAAGGATGMYPAKPGGMIRIVEGGYPEAVLTTDPRHATQQVRILQRYLKETRGLFGRIPGFAQGGFDIARDAEAEMLQSLSNSRSGIPAPSPSLQPAISGGDTNLRILNLWDRKQIAGGYIRSSEGARDIMNVLSENASEVSRRISIK